MSIETPLTSLLGIHHPVLLAPMDLIAGARLMGTEPEEETPGPPDTRTIVAAAQAFAERTRARVRGLAA